MDRKIFDLFKSFLIHGDMVYIANKGVVQSAIGESQKPLDNTWTRRVTHSAFINDEGDVCEVSIVFNISFVKKFPFIKISFASGIQIRPIESWFNKNDESIVLIVQRLRGLTPEQIKGISDRGRELKKEGKHYPIIELVGTLVAYVNYKLLGSIKWINPKFIDSCRESLLNKPNPLNVKNARYCIAFANNCFQTGGGVRLLPPNLHESIAYVGAGFRTDHAYDAYFFVPNAPVYSKEQGQIFDCPDPFKK